MTSSPFNYSRFNGTQVSKSALMGGFRISDQQWSDITSVVTTELTKRGLTPDHKLSAKSSKQVVEAVRQKMLRAFPELSFYVPQQWLQKGTYQIIRVIHTARKREASATRKLKFAAIQIPGPPTDSATTDRDSPSSDIKAYPGSPAVSYEPAAEPTPALAPPAVALAHPTTMYNTSNVANFGSLPTNTTPTQVDVTGVSSTPGLAHWQSNVKDSRSSPDNPSQLLLAPPFPHIQIHEDLRKIQLHAARLNDQKDSSFINLGELVFRKDNREGLRAISYTSLEDLTDQDWQYWHGTILANDLDNGFDIGIDKIYHDNGGEEMIRVKNAHNWRAAMVAMRTAGLTHFKFYVEQPQAQRESTLNRLLMPVSSAL